MTTDKSPRLIKWAKDGYPPIDFNNEFRALIELIKAYEAKDAELSRMQSLLENIRGAIATEIDLQPDFQKRNASEDGYVEGLTKAINIIESYTTLRKENKTTD